MKKFLLRINRDILKAARVRILQFSKFTCEVVQNIKFASRHDKYSKHVNSSVMDPDKQNKSLVRRKRITTKT